MSNEDDYARMASNISWPRQCNEPLSALDPEVVDIIEKEKNRQWKGLELIPSENFTTRAVMEAIGSIMTNKYDPSPHLNHTPSAPPSLSGVAKPQPRWLRIPCTCA